MKAFKFIYEEHAPIVKDWPKKRDFPFPPEQIIPNIGFIVEDMACGFLYTTNSSIAWVEWIFSNPEKDKEERVQAIDMVFKLLEMTAKDLGYTFLFSASAFGEFSRILERNGFTETDKGMSHFLKGLKGE